MGFCGSCVRFSSGTLVAVLAVLVYFHMECVKEMEKQKKNANLKVFRPEVTDVNNTPLRFCSFGENLEMNIGLEFILIQSAPCALLKLLHFLKIGTKLSENKFESMSSHNVTIHDARKNSLGSFFETGFTLIELEAEPVTKDWRTSSVYDENADIKHFHNQMEPHIRNLYPQVKRMEWTYNVVTGGSNFGDLPIYAKRNAVGGPHLDYHQNDTARILFHKKFPAIGESAQLMGEKDDENGKLGVVLGVWKPIHPAAVCDFPLAVMDTRTFQPEYQCINNLHINFGVLTFHNLAAAISYSPKQKWAYYSFQTTREVLVFHHYSKNRFFANPHASFINNNCPEGTENRVSVNMRLALYF